MELILVFLIGVAIAAIGGIVWLLSFVLLGARAQRYLNKNVQDLQKMLDSGEAAQYGDDGEELFQRAIKYQQENQVGPIPLAWPGIALIVAGVLIAMIAWFVS